MKKLVMIALAAMTAASSMAAPFTYEKDSKGTPMISFTSTQRMVTPSAKQTFSVAPLHSPMTGSRIAQLRVNSGDDMPMKGDVLSSGSEYSSVITGAGPALVSRPRREGEYDPFGGETIGDVDNPMQPGSPVGEGLWLLLLMAAGYGLRMRQRLLQEQKEIQTA